MESNADSHSRPGYDVGIYAFGVFFILRCILLYGPLTYPQYTAIAGRAILFAETLFIHLRSGQEVRLLAGLTVACVGGIWVLYVHGARIRAGSQFAVRQGNEDGWSSDVDDLVVTD